MPRGNFQKVPAPDDKIMVGACGHCLRGYRVNVTGVIKRHARPGGLSNGTCLGGRELPAFVERMAARDYKAGMEMRAS